MAEVLEQKLVKFDTLETEMLKKLAGIVMPGIDIHLIQEVKSFLN
jgi:hypothetical protein